MVKFSQSIPQFELSNKLQKGNTLKFPRSFNFIQAIIMDWWWLLMSGYEKYRKYIGTSIGWTPGQTDLAVLMIKHCPHLTLLRVSDLFITAEKLKLYCLIVLTSSLLPKLNSSLCNRAPLFSRIGDLSVGVNLNPSCCLDVCSHFLAHFCCWNCAEKS